MPSKKLFKDMSTEEQEVALEKAAALADMSRDERNLHYIKEEQKNPGLAVGPRILWADADELGMTPEEFKRGVEEAGGRMPEGFSFINVAKNYGGGFDLKVKVPKKGGGFALVPMNKFNDPYNVSSLKNPPSSYYRMKDQATGIAVGYGADVRGLMRSRGVDREHAESMMVMMEGGQSKKLTREFFKRGSL